MTLDSYALPFNPFRKECKSSSRSYFIFLRPPTVGNRADLESNFVNLMVFKLRLCFPKLIHRNSICLACSTLCGGNHFGTFPKQNIRWRLCRAEMVLLYMQAGVLACPVCRCGSCERFGWKLVGWSVRCWTTPMCTNVELG